MKDCGVGFLNESWLRFFVQGRSFRAVEPVRHFSLGTAKDPTAPRLEGNHTATGNLKPSTLNRLNPKPSTLNPKPSTLNPKPSTLNPQHVSPVPKVPLGLPGFWSVEMFAS